MSMYRSWIPSNESTRKSSLAADLLVVVLVGAIIHAITNFGQEWRAEFHPVTEISLHLSSLVVYSIFSALRGLAAYVLSLTFTLIVGYAAAKSARAERFIVPILDILQSIPVLGFLPGLVLGLIALFPHTNTGLELAAILMIFTGQVWNMTFSFYSSLKSVPSDFDEASRVIGLSWWERLLNLELPFSAVNLAWNSLMSMAGGWFFLTVCESFPLGDQQFRLPGIGSYMAAAIDAGDTRAMTFGVIAMITVIISMDFFIWRPVMAYVHRFRLEEVAGSATTEPLIQLLLRDSILLRLAKAILKSRRLRRTFKPSVTPTKLFLSPEFIQRIQKRVPKINPLHLFGYFLVGASLGLLTWGSIHLFSMLSHLSGKVWLGLFRDCLYTLARVLVTLVLSTIWAVPAGIWIGTSAKRIRIAQPIIQVMASFPAPMLYPIALAIFFHLGFQFGIGSMFLMMLGVQWYVLFNVLAGALRVPQELRYALNLMKISKIQQWKTLFIPSVFPALVTGWVTAAGGAWNASIVAEYISYKGKIITTHGIGATISIATSNKDFGQLAASLTLMVAIVIVLNRTVWSRVYKLAQTRFRLDL